jgi:hypothetical protein
MKRLLGIACLLATYAGCNCSSNGLTSTAGSDAGPDAGGPVDSGGFDLDGGNCTANSTDLTGCACSKAGDMRSCYPQNVPPQTRGVGLCHDGTQTCQLVGELSAWGACTGYVIPQLPNCTDGLDQDCSGKVGCADPACAENPSCNTGCDAGDTRKCYDGPAGTENVGLCRDGVQVCTGGQWPSTCQGEVLPAPENCCDLADHNCNGLPGCFDFFYCNASTSSCCAIGACDAGPGCFCPQGAGDGTTCPDGTHEINHITWVACCPCTAADCGSPSECCGTPVCAGASACAGLTCNPLPPSCNGQTNTDCDDFPEDCDEPCCKCNNCGDAGCGISGSGCNTSADCCPNLACDPNSGVCM